jgi:hypothetical protein
VPRSDIHEEASVKTGARRLGERQVKIYPELGLGFSVLRSDAILQFRVALFVHQGGELSWKDPSSASTP